MSDRKTTPYRIIGTTYDGVKVIAPKMKSKVFKPYQLRRLIRKLLRELTQ